MAKLVRSIRVVALLAWMILPTNALGDDASVPQLIKRLKSSDPQTILGALYDVKSNAALADPTILKRLSHFAGHDDAEVREAACEKLAEAGPLAKGALPVLEPRLKDPVISVRIAAAEAIWRVESASEKAAAVLAATLSTAEINDRYAAASILQRMGAEASSALPEVVACLRDERADVRFKAIEILGEFGANFADRLEPSLVVALQDQSPSVRVAAATALHQIDRPSAQAIRVLIEIAKSEPKPTEKNRGSVFGGGLDAARAISAFVFLGADAAEATPTLVKSLKSPILAIRLNAAEALGEIGPSAVEAIPALGVALRETETHSFPFVHRAFSVGENAANALVQIGAPAADTLIQALDDDDVAVCAHAIRALGSIPAAANKSIGPLTRRLADKHPLVRIEAAKSVGRLHKSAEPAVPALTRLLFDDRAFTSFRGGMGIGDKESVRAEALKSFTKIAPEARLVVPVLLETLRQAKDVPYEALVVVRRFASSLRAAKPALLALLKDEEARMGAACALAVIAPKQPGIEKILLQGLIIPATEEGEDDQLNAIAALGLGELALRGTELQPATRDRLQHLAKEQSSLFLDSTRLKIQTDRVTAVALLHSLRTSHSVFEAAGIHEAEHTLRLLASRPPVRTALLESLSFVATTKDAEDSYFRRRIQGRARLQASTVLVDARLDLARVVDSLGELARTKDVGVRGAAADLLAECGQATKDQSVSILQPILADGRAYVVDGDFYGNGGERRTAGERAAMALLSLGAVDALQSRLDDEDYEVRVRVIRSLGDAGPSAISSSLLARVSDKSPTVRRELMRTLGKLARSDARAAARIRPLLVAAKDDRWRSVRDEAQRSLAALP